MCTTCLIQGTVYKVLGNKMWQSQTLPNITFPNMLGTFIVNLHIISYTSKCVPDLQRQIAYGTGISKCVRRGHGPSVQGCKFWHNTIQGQKASNSLEVSIHDSHTASNCAVHFQFFVFILQYRLTQINLTHATCSKITQDIRSRQLTEVIRYIQTCHYKVAVSLGGCSKGSHQRLFQSRVSDFLFNKMHTSHLVNTRILACCIYKCMNAVWSLVTWRRLMQQQQPVHFHTKSEVILGMGITWVK